MDFRRMNTVLAILITMGQVGYQNLQKKQTNNIILSFRAYGLWFGTYVGRHTALLFVHQHLTLFEVYAQPKTYKLR